MKLKICGITNKKDAEDAINLGVDALGFICYSKSPRYVTEESLHEIIGSIPPFVTSVGVFVNEEPDVINEFVKNYKLDVVQLHGEESPEDCMKINTRVIKAIHVDTMDDIQYVGKYNGTVSGILLDTKVNGTYGGTGKSFDWGVALAAKDFGMPIVLSGGISIDNLNKAVQLVKPEAIDLCSSVEQSPGLKDYEKMKDIITLFKSL